MREVVVISAVRTAVGTFGGSLKDISPVDLGATVIKEALGRAGVKAEQVDEVIMGCVLQAGFGQNIARQAALKGGLPIETPCLTINKVCGSGLKSVTLAASIIAAGDADIIVAGGTENMSAAPYLNFGARWGLRMGDSTMIDSMVKDGLWCAFNDYHMGMTAENLAVKFNITREQQDQFALESQEKAQKAIESGRFKDEIVPVMVPQRKGDPLVFAIDEHPRMTNMDSLAKLKPAFKKDGTVTAGNASGINDSAAAIVVMSSDKAKELGLKPFARIKSFASEGVDPSIMGTGPIPATQKALAKAGWSVSDLQLIEANEAFAVQALAVSQELGFDPSIVNVNGGAIAIGHPIGASGARIFVTLLHEMHKREVQRGLATLCIGGGQGIACAVEML